MINTERLNRLYQLLNKPDDNGAWMTAQMRLMEAGFHAGDADLPKTVYHNLTYYFSEDLVVDYMMKQYDLHHQERE